MAMTALYHHGVPIFRLPSAVQLHKRAQREQTRIEMGSSEQYSVLSIAVDSAIRATSHVLLVGSWMQKKINIIH